MSKLIILVLSCQAHRKERQAAVLATWARHLEPGQDLYVAEGGHRKDRIVGNRIQLTAPDGYADLAEKSFQLLSFCLNSMEFEGILKCDDDTFLDCHRLAAACGTFGNYRGLPAEDQRQFVPYARGGCYWLSRGAVESLVAEPFETHRDAPWFKGNSRMRKLGERSYRDKVSIEDVMVGSLLHESGIRLEPDTRFHDRLRPPLYASPEPISNHYVNPLWMYRLERMRHWPASLPSRMLMRMWTLLPSASPPK